MPDDDVSHAVNARLERLEEAAGLGPIGEDKEETDEEQTSNTYEEEE